MNNLTQRKIETEAEIERLENIDRNSFNSVGAHRPLNYVKRKELKAQLSILNFAISEFDDFVKKLKEECDKYDGYVDIDFIDKLASEEK